jgi:hypothetical protein
MNMTFQRLMTGMLSLIVRQGFAVFCLNPDMAVRQYIHTNQILNLHEMCQSPYIKIVTESLTAANKEFRMYFNGLSRCLFVKILTKTV